MSTPRLTEIIEKQYLDSFSGRAARGELFEFSIKDTDLDIADPIVVLFKTGAKKVHIRRALDVLGGGAELIVYAGPTVTDNGTEIDTYNQYHGSTTESLMSVYSAPTVSDNGTQCFQPSTLIGSSSIPSRARVGISDRVNRVLAANTNYLVIITADTDNEKAVYSCEYFEA